MTRPAVSVILPVHNGQPYLEGAIRSILSQTFADLELFVIDDGSTDASALVARAVARADRRVHLVEQPHRGQPAALNYGLALARADLIARMDADDLASPDRFALQVDFLRRHPEVGMLGGATLQMSARGRALRSMRYPTRDAAIRRALRSETAYFCHPSIMFRANLVRRAGGYRAAFQPAEDYDLYLRVGEHAELANLRQTILAYRIHPTQLSVTRIEQQVLGGWGARCDATARAAGQVEPFGDRPVTLERLHECGCDLTRIANDIIGTIATRAALFATIGDLEASRRLLEQARDAARQVPLEASVRARIAAGSACLLLGEGRVRDGLCALVCTTLANPGWAAMGLRRWLRIAQSQWLPSPKVTVDVPCDVAAEIVAQPAIHLVTSALPSQEVLDGA